MYGYTTTHQDPVNVYFHYRCENNYFHYAPCTTTVVPQRFRGRQVPHRDSEQLRNVYHYFHDVP